MDIRRLLMTCGDDVLKHETRKTIYDHILAQPGVSYNVLKKLLNLTDGTLRYHLAYLERTEKIKFGLERGKRLYFPNQDELSASQLSVDNTRPYRLTPVQSRLLETIKRYPGISQTELMQRTNLRRYTIINNLKKLLTMNIVRKTPNGKNVFYEYITNEQLRYEILKGLVIKLLKKEIDEKTFLELKKEIE